MGRFPFSRCVLTVATCARDVLPPAADFAVCCSSFCNCCELELRGAPAFNAGLLFDVFSSREGLAAVLLLFCAAAGMLTATSSNVTIHGNRIELPYIHPISSTHTANLRCSNSNPMRGKTTRTKIVGNKFLTRLPGYPR